MKACKTSLEFCQHTIASGHGPGGHGHGDEGSSEEMMDDYEDDDYHGHGKLKIHYYF